MFGTKQNNQYLKNVLLLYLFPLSKFDQIIQVIPKGLYQRNAKISRFIEARNFLSAEVITSRVIPYLY